MHKVSITMKAHILKKLYPEPFPGVPKNSKRCKESVFFLSGFSFANIPHSQNSSGERGYLFNSSLPLTPA